MIKKKSIHECDASIGDILEVYILKNKRDCKYKNISKNRLSRIRLTLKILDLTLTYYI